MQLFIKIINQIQHPLRNFLVEYACFVARHYGVISQQLILGLFLSSTVFFIFLFGVNSKYLSCMFTGSLITPLLAHDLTIFLQKFEYREYGLSYLLESLEYISSNSREVSVFLCLLSIAGSLYFSKVPWPVRSFLFAVYYFKTIYPLANMADFFLESVICSSFFLLLAYLLYYQTFVGEILTSVFYSLIASTITVVTMYKMNSFEIENVVGRLLSLDLAFGNVQYNAYVILVVLSIASQHAIRMLSPRIKKMPRI
ncbi:uncharacterized protein VICG_01196 [Vittaforma corneae ATCC 50505]|uniref:Uncharacterized protein n=1 Tax=Vittaforma corneae (strain ATCC 50505) TaxID=993615 RepID=L2GMI0_VITCO|nr:uncharacterized protein VICG_01196 [Vittaforma corneae ATCC 50505]ELA41844.1 hypothetical protein VICG_01196 [Vittaforma corneae ATCC 50505]